MKVKLFMLLLLGVLMTGCTPSSDEPQSMESTPASAVEEAQDASEEAPQEKEPYLVTFEAKTVEGEAFTSDAFADSKLTMINVWGTYCNPCLSEMPDLGEIAASYDKAEFQMLGIISDVMEDAGEGKIEEAKDLIEQTGAAYPHVLANQSLYNSLLGAVSAVPTTFFVNQKGEMLGYVVGGQPKEAWENIIRDLLEEMEDSYE